MKVSLAPGNVINAPYGEHHIFDVAAGGTNIVQFVALTQHNQRTVGYLRGVPADHFGISKFDEQHPVTGGKFHYFEK